jgi:hypothetical protein
LNNLINTPPNAGLLTWATSTKAFVSRIAKTYCGNAHNSDQTGTSKSMTAQLRELFRTTLACNIRGSTLQCCLLGGRFKVSQGSVGNHPKSRATRCEI